MKAAIQTNSQTWHLSIKGIYDTEILQEAQHTHCLDVIVRQRAEHGTKKQSPNARKKVRNKPQRNVHDQKNTYTYIHVTPQ